MSVERLRRKLHSLLCRCLHDFGVAMAGHAVGTGNQAQRAGTLMFLVARRTRAVLHDISFVECVRPAILFKMAGLTFSVDRIERDAVTKTVAQHGLEC